jgi:DNA-binding winged helix-turn-helix (wHTH) protein
MVRQEYQVGRFVLQPFRQLLDGECPVSIRRKALQLLSVLAGARGALVTKDELMAAVWPNAVVEDNALQVHIASLRKLLFADAHLLSTVHGFGYRLAATPLAAQLDCQLGFPAMDSRTARRWRGEQPSPPSGIRTNRVLPPGARRLQRSQNGNLDDNRGTGYAQTVRLAQKCSERAVLRLAELVQSGDERVALLASQALLDRAFDKSRDCTDPSPTAKRLRNLIAILVTDFDDDVAEHAVDGMGVNGAVHKQAKRL